MNIRLIIVLLLTFAPAALRADTLKITYADAYALFVALSSLKDGLTPDNTGLASDDMTVLKPHADAFSKATAAAAKAFRQATHDKDPDAARQAAQDNFDKFSATVITVEIQPFAISNDEISAAHIAPSTLQPIRQYLAPAKKK